MTGTQRRRGTVVGLALAGGIALGPVAANAVGTSPPSPSATPAEPAECSVEVNGDLPTCHLNKKGHWVVTYPAGSEDPFGGSGDGTGFPGVIIVGFVLVAVLGVGGTIWRIAAARRMATSAGLDPADATTAALFGRDGVDATYVASTIKRSLGSPAPPAAATPTPSSSSSSRPVADRLKELEQLRNQGLITTEEYATRRSEILGAV